MKKELLLAATVAALLTTGCSEHADQTTTPDSPIALQLRGGIQTRAHDATWDQNDSIGVFMLNQTTAELSNRAYFTALGDGAFAAAQGAIIYLPVDGTTRNFVAYYPYVKNLGADGKTVSLDLSNQNPQRAIDLMGAGTVVDKSKTDPDVAFTFTHKLSKLVLSIEAGEGLTTSELAQTVVRLTNQQTRGTYDVLAGGAVSVTAGTPETLVLVTTANGLSAEGIVLPNTDTQDMKLTFSVPNVGTFDWAVKSAPQSQRFEAGKKYLYTITVNKTALKVTSTVTDWLPGNGTGENGSAE